MCWIPLSKRVSSVMYVALPVVVVVVVVFVVNILSALIFNILCLFVCVVLLGESTVGSSCNTPGSFLSNYGRLELICSNGT